MWPSNVNGDHCKTIVYIFYAPQTSCVLCYKRLWIENEPPSVNVQIGSKSSIFRSVWPWNLTADTEIIRESVPCSWKLCASFYIHPWIYINATVLQRRHCSQIVTLSAHMTLEFDALDKQQGTYSISPNLCASFYSHPWIQVIARKPSYPKEVIYLSVPVTLGFDGWTSNIARQLLYAISRFLHQFVVICEF